MGGTSPRVAQKMGGKAKAMTKEALQQYFDMPMVDVAKIFGVCPTYFKRICRSHGIMRWPYRKLRSMSRKDAYGVLGNGRFGVIGPTGIVQQSSYALATASDDKAGSSDDDDDDDDDNSDCTMPCSSDEGGQSPPSRKRAAEEAEQGSEGFDAMRALAELATPEAKPAKRQRVAEKPEKKPSRDKQSIKSKVGEFNQALAESVDQETQKRSAIDYRPVVPDMSRTNFNPLGMVNPALMQAMAARALNLQTAMMMTASQQLPQLSQVPVNSFMRLPVPQMLHKIPRPTQLEQLPHLLNASNLLQLQQLYSMQLATNK